MTIEIRNLSSVAVSLAFAGGLIAPFAASAADVPPSYKASPDVYKVLAENDQFRIILQTLKPGQRDAWHSHPALAGYRLSDCTSKAYLPDGKVTERVGKRGDAGLQAPVASHSVENTGKTVCEIVLVERK